MISHRLVVLIVEDDSLLRTAMANILTDGGFEVLQAEDGEDGLEVLTSRLLSVDSMLTDIRMPGSFDGLELARRAYELCPGLSITVTSGTERPAISRLPPYSKFVAKPFSAAALLECVSRP